MKKIVLSALAVASLAGSTFGQAIGPSLGTVELRWSERSTAGFNGSYALGAGAISAPAVTNGAAPTAAQVTQQDSVVVLVLQARVTGNVGGPAIRGLMAAGFDITTNQASGGSFTTFVNNDGTPELNPRGGANSGTNAAGQANLGYNPGTVLGAMAGAANRGVVAPFRSVANNNSANGAALGVASANGNTLSKVTLGAQTADFDPNNIDATNPGEFNLLGLGQWVDVYVAIYNISDVSSVRDIVFTVRNSPATAPNPDPTDYGFRTWTGGSNSQNGGLDLWQLTPGFSVAPTFTVSVVPAPGAAALLGLGGMIAARRRRQA